MLTAVGRGVGGGSSSLCGLSGGRADTWNPLPPVVVWEQEIDLDTELLHLAVVSDDESTSGDSASVGVGVSGVD